MNKLKGFFYCSQILEKQFIRYRPNYSFSNKVSSTEEKHDPESPTDTIYKKYLDDLASNSSEFQSEFGFVKKLGEAREESFKREKKFSKFFQGLWILIASLGTYIE